MKIEVSNMIKLPKDKLSNFNYRSYVYTKTGQVDELVQNFWLDKDYIYIPRNKAKFLQSWNGEDVEFINNFVETKVKNKIDIVPNFKLRDYQQKAMEDIMISFSKGNNDVLLEAGTGFGKEQPYSEPVLTPNGWTTMGELNIGDYVVGSDGKPKRIIGIYEQGNKDVYNVYFTNGAMVRCGLEHLWEVKTDKGFEVVTLKTLINTIDKEVYKIKLPKNLEYLMKKYPIKSNIEFNEDFVTMERIEKAGYKEQSRCIMIDSEDHLYITKDFILTHNTYLMSYILHKMQLKTLILTDMTMLSEQMYKEITTNTNADIQIVNKDTKEIKDVNIVTYQLLNRNPHMIDKFKDEIGLIVADEIQNTGAESVKTIIQQFPAKYRLGLSATPTRSDGLTEVISDVYPFKVKSSGVNMKVNVHFVKEMEYMLNPTNYRKNLNATIEQLFIPTIDIMVEKLVGKMNKSIMIAVDSKDIQEELANKYSKYGTAILNSATKSKERQQILQDYEDEKIKILLGYKVLNKGISIPRMEILINLFAATTKENIEQLVGRLMRSHPKKEVVTFVDFVFGLNMFRQMNVKKETYDKLNRDGKIKSFKVYSHSNYRDLLSKI